jgi:hypothetical protein
VSLLVAYVVEEVSGGNTPDEGRYEEGIRIAAAVRVEEALKLFAFAIETLLFLGLASLVAYLVFQGCMWMQQLGYDYEKKRIELRRSMVEE